MSTNNFVVEIHGTTGATLTSRAIPREKVGIFKNAKRRTRDPVRRERGGKRPTFVVASPVADSRRRWSQCLQEMAAVSEVTDRAALEHAMINDQPDVLVVDLAFSGLRRVRGLPELQTLSPSTKIVVLTDSPSEGEGVLVLKAGARGYCTRAIDPEHLKKAVGAVQQGEIWAPRRLVPGLIAELRSLAKSLKKEGRQHEVDPRLENLTERQRLVADLISRGASNKEIARQLGISERTVKAHLTKVFRNVGVSDRLQLAIFLN